MYKSTEERHWNGMELRTRGEWRELVGIDSFQNIHNKNDTKAAFTEPLISLTLATRVGYPCSRRSVLKNETRTALLTSSYNKILILLFPTYGTYSCGTQPPVVITTLSYLDD